METLSRRDFVAGATAAGLLLAALIAFRAAGRQPPVNLVFVAEGEEEIGSPHFPQVVRIP
jgi:acetylornithine deacetylase/succinyl-diaminopimelate desuccinylase-like protein